MTILITAAHRYIIVDKEWGVYIGSAMGMGFWSKLDPVGQSCAATFGTPVEAMEWINTWETGRERPFTFLPVIPDVETHASIKACVAGGADAWDPNAVPVLVEPPQHLDVSVAPKRPLVS